LLRLGIAHEEIGDHPSAIAYYTRYADTPTPIVAEVRAHVENLKKDKLTVAEATRDDKLLAALRARASSMPVYHADACFGDE
jgi:hypothetical protein